MLFNSYAFIFLFLPITLFLFFWVGKYSQQSALKILFFASMIFYCFWDFRYIALLLFSILINFCISKKITNTISALNKKKFLWLGIIFNLSLLGYYKYTNFFISNINNAFHAHFEYLKITLPLGISFFTFTQIAFLVDSYRGLIGQYRLLNYGLFVTYFPHLIAGPIIHHKEVMPQFDKPRTFRLNYRYISLGLTIFAIGFFKKVILADRLGLLVGPIFDTHLSHINFTEAWISSLAYTLELYFDFSGYSDMAIGISLLFGIKLPVNFYSPYKSINIIEFWRRWNMTLSRFLRDYLYIPLGGNRKGLFNRYLNLIVTMLLGGLWHGANWTFVLWGSLHGMYLCINHGWMTFKKYLGLTQSHSIIFKLLSCSVTFLAVVIAWVFFRSPDISTAHHILYAMFLEKPVLPLPWASSMHGSIGAMLNHLHIHFMQMNADILTHDSIVLLVLSFMMIWSLPNTYQLLSKFKPALLVYHIQQTIKKKTILAWKPTFAWSFFVVLIFLVSIVNIQKSSIFLYFQF